MLLKTSKDAAIWLENIIKDFINQSLNSLFESRVIRK